MSVEAITRRCRSHAGDERSLRIAVVDKLHRAVPFDAHAFLLTDPATEVGVSPLAEVPSLAELPRLIRAKYLAPVGRWTSLGEGEVVAGPPWSDLLATHGVVEVASLVLRDRGGCWGWLDLWRSKPFHEREVATLAAVAPALTAALRAAAGRTFDEPVAGPERAGPAVLLLSDDLDVTAQTPDTERFLRALLPPDGDARPIPAAVYNVAAQLLAAEAGVDDHPPRARLHLDGGSWLTLAAARAGAGIAVTIEPTPPADRRDLYARAHALSPRETEVLDLLAAGADTRAVAGELFLSEHTVQDHLKAIFAKTGTHNRRTLLARVNGG